jgi:hypothetical protein
MTMELLDAFRTHALALPNLAKFALLLALIVGVPALARRLRIPELVGLVVVGLLLGPHVLGLYGANHPIAQFFADLGRLMLMFAAGLEIDLDLFRKAQTRSITFVSSRPSCRRRSAPLMVWRSAMGLFPLSSSARCSHRTL